MAKKGELLGAFRELVQESGRVALIDPQTVCAVVDEGREGLSVVTLTTGTRVVVKGSPEDVVSALNG